MISAVPETEIKTEKKREHVWWAKDEKHDGSADDRYLESEYSSTFVDESSASLNDSFTNRNGDSFPVGLNPHFDLQSLVMVRDYLTGIFTNGIISMERTSKEHFLKISQRYECKTCQKSSQLK